MTDDIIENIVELLQNQGKMEMIEDLRKFLRENELKSDVSNQVHMNVIVLEIIGLFNGHLFVRITDKFLGRILLLSMKLIQTNRKSMNLLSF